MPQFKVCIDNFSLLDHKFILLRYENKLSPYFSDDLDALVNFQSALTFQFEYWFDIYTNIFEHLGGGEDEEDSTYFYIFYCCVEWEM